MFFFFSSRRRHTRWNCDWSSDVCSSDLEQAIQGFLKGAGLASLDQAEKRDTGKGEFWFAVINRKGGPAAASLPGVIEGAMKALPWPKAMKWGSGSMLWVRPLK